MVPFRPSSGVTQQPQAAFNSFSLPASTICVPLIKYAPFLYSLITASSSVIPKLIPYFENYVIEFHIVK